MEKRFRPLHLELYNNSISKNAVTADYDAGRILCIPGLQAGEHSRPFLNCKRNLPNNKINTDYTVKGKVMKNA